MKFFAIVCLLGLLVFQIVRADLGADLGAAFVSNTNELTGATATLNSVQQGVAASGPHAGDNAVSIAFVLDIEAEAEKICLALVQAIVDTFPETSQTTVHDCVVEASSKRVACAPRSVGEKRPVGCQAMEVLTATAYMADSGAATVASSLAAVVALLAVAFRVF
jgi:hypothetical protein